MGPVDLIQSELPQTFNLLKKKCAKHNKTKCNKRRYTCIIRSFYFGCLEELFPILCEFQELFRLFLSSVFTGLKLSFLLCMHISVVSQRVEGTPLQISSSSSLLPLFCPANSTLPGFPEFCSLSQLSKTVR